MKDKLLPMVVFLALGVLAKATDGHASFAEDDYLWLEFGQRVKEKDGALTLPLQINYGRFPDQKKGLGELAGLRAFYTLTEKDNAGNRIFYEAEIEKNSGKCLVHIKSFKTNRFIVLVEGRKSAGEVRYCYLAKTSFILFGHSPSQRKKIRPVPSNEIDRQFEIALTPEFSDWPQTGNPVRMAPLFGKDHLREKVLYIFDENHGSGDIKTDKTGSCTYIPPDDKKLNWEGVTAFKQTVIVAEESKGNTNYLSSYTLLLHRSRTKNRRLLPGAGIFGATLAGVFLLVIAGRKRFRV